MTICQKVVYVRRPAFALSLLPPAEQTGTKYRPRRSFFFFSPVRALSFNAVLVRTLLPRFITLTERVSSFSPFWSAIRNGEEEEEEVENMFQTFGARG